MVHCSGGPAGSTRDNEDCNNDDDGIDDGDDDDALPLNKQRYGSVIDYLKAKYVRGMMIDNCEEMRAAQGCGKKKRRGGGGGKGEPSGADN